jgi:hypothetical protein
MSTFFVTVFQQIVESTVVPIEADNIEEARKKALQTNRDDILDQACNACWEFVDVQNRWIDGVEAAFMDLEETSPEDLHRTLQDFLGE